MCWSFPVSATSYCIVLAFCTRLFFRNKQNDRWIASLVLLVGQVQFLEAVMWLDQECRGANQAANIVLMVIITAEPLGHALIAIMFADKPGWSLPLLAGMSAVFATLTALGIRPYADQLCALPASVVGLPIQQHLRWGWIPPGSDYFRIIFTLLLAAPFAWLKPTQHAVVYAFYTLATSAVARYMLPGGASFESMWCWLAVGGSLMPFLLEWRLQAACAPEPELPVKAPSELQLRDRKLEQMPLTSVVIIADR